MHVVSLPDRTLNHFFLIFDDPLSISQRNWKFLNNTTIHTDFVLLVPSVFVDLPR